MTLLPINGGLWIVWLVYWYVAARFVNRTKTSEGLLGRLIYAVPLGLGMFVIFRGRSDPILYGPLGLPRSVQWLGMMLTVAGLLYMFWARIHLGRNWSATVTLKEGHTLIRSGPYQFTRHPIYTGFTTAALGSALVAATGDALVGFAAVVISFLIKIHREETFLTREFGDEYLAFQREVPALVPFVY